MSSIPRILFQTWKEKTNLPENFAYWSLTFRTENPNYAYRLWDDADNRAFIEQNYPWFLETYDAYPAEIYRVDAVRYFFLYQFGGIYADLDTECLRPLDPLLDAADVILGRMGPNDDFDHSLPNAVMMSAPRQEFWLFVMSLMLDTPKTLLGSERPEYRTGPVMLKLAHNFYTRQYREDVVQNRIGHIRSLLKPELEASREQSKIAALPGNAFFPLDWNDKVHDHFVRKPLIKGGALERSQALSLFPHSYTVTYWSHSWEPQND